MFRFSDLINSECKLGNSLKQNIQYDLTQEEFVVCQILTEDKRELLM